jgi:hypothetical protein
MMYKIYLVILRMPNSKETEIVYSLSGYTTTGRHLIELRDSFWCFLAASVLTLKEFDERELDLLGTTAITSFNNIIASGCQIADLLVKDNVNVYNKQLIAIFASITGAFGDFAITSARKKIIVTVEIGSCALHRSLKEIDGRPSLDCSTLCVYPSMIRTLLNTYNDKVLKLAKIDGNRIIVKGNYCTFCYEL